MNLMRLPSWMMMRAEWICMIRRDGMEQHSWTWGVFGVVKHERFYDFMT
jgi:hypothetical protein